MENEPDLSKYFKVEVEKFNVVEYITMILTVTYESKDGEELLDDLPGHKPTEDDKPSIKFKPEVKEWLEENLTGQVYATTMAVMYFEKEDDAVHFKVRWG